MELSVRSVLEVFVPIVAELKALAKQAQEVDVTNEREVNNCRLELKNKRVEITKKCKEYRDGANAFSLAITAFEKELIEIIEPQKEIEAEAAVQEVEKIKKRERAEKYKSFRAEFGWTEERAVHFYEKVEVDRSGERVILFKRVGEFNLYLLE